LSATTLMHCTSIANTTMSDTIANVASSVTDPDVEEPGRRPRFLTLRRFIPS
jgi:hypothetical protein